MEKLTRVVAIYGTHADAEPALRAFELVVAHGTVDDIAAAQRILATTGALWLDEHRAAA